MNLRFETPFEQTDQSPSACGTVTVESSDGGTEPEVPELPGDVPPVALGGAVLVLLIVALLVV